MLSTMFNIRTSKKCTPYAFRKVYEQLSRTCTISANDGSYRTIAVEMFLILLNYIAGAVEIDLPSRQNE